MSFITIDNISWNRPDGSNLFRNINLSCGLEKTGLTGNNGSGKSILTKIITGVIKPSQGKVTTAGRVSLLPQDLTSYNNNSIIELFNLSEKYDALKRILNGNGAESDFLKLDDDWDLEERVNACLAATGIDYLPLTRQFSSLSGGEQIRCALSALLNSNPDFIILDEPTNHLDDSMREFVYNFADTFQSGILVISHDRELLRRMNRIIELKSDRCIVYGGNYDFYAEQKDIELRALEENLRAAEIRLEGRVTEMNEAMQKQSARMKSAANKTKDQIIPKSVIHKLKGRSEQTTAKIKRIHEKRIQLESDNVKELKMNLPAEKNIKIDYSNNKIPNAKKIVVFDEVNLTFDGRTALFKNNFCFTLIGNERLWLRGKNGSGKSTVLKLIIGGLVPATGAIYNGAASVAILDQNVSMLNDNDSVYENVLRHSGSAIPEYQIRVRLARLLFFNDDIYKKAGILSGGERVRAGMACIFAAAQKPELLLLDEPTNNLDLNSVSQLTLMLNDYNGPLIVISHDKDFINDLKIKRELILE